MIEPVFWGILFHPLPNLPYDEIGPLGPCLQCPTSYGFSCFHNISTGLLPMAHCLLHSLYFSSTPDSALRFSLFFFFASAWNLVFKDFFSFRALLSSLFWLLSASAPAISSMSYYLVCFLDSLSIKMIFKLFSYLLLLY